MSPAEPPPELRPVTTLKGVGQALADRLAAVLTDGALAREPGERARAKVEAELSVSEQVRRLASLIVSEAMRRAS